MRETFRRMLRRGKDQIPVKKPSQKGHEGEIMQVAKSHIITIAPTTPIYDAIQLMNKEGFRRIPIVSAGSKALEGIVTAMDMVDYLGGGEKFQIIQQRFEGSFFRAINEPTRLIMAKRVVTLGDSAKVSEAINLMKEKDVGGIPIVDVENHVKGIITERDIANWFADMISGVTVAQLMSSDVTTASPVATVYEAERMMVTKGFRRLPIIADHRIVGILTTMDIVRYFGSGRVFEFLKSGSIGQVLNTSALEIAKEDVLTIQPNADVGEAARMMRDNDIGGIPVLEKSKLIGMITERDFFKVIE